MEKNVNVDVVTNNVVTNNVADSTTANAPVPESVPTTAEEQGYSYASMNKGANEILKATRTINQCVKLFNGILNEKYTIGKETRTFKDWFKICGVPFTGNGGLTAKNLLSVWPYKEESKTGTICKMYKNVPAYIVGGDGDKPELIPVYAFDGAKWNKVSRMELVVIEKWSADVVLRGLLQGAFPKKIAEKVEKSLTAWNELEEIFTFEKRNDKGGVNNKAIKAQKNSVNF